MSAASASDLGRTSVSDPEYGIEQAFGPDCLGRSVLVSAGSPAPPPWSDCERIVVRTSAVDRTTGLRLRTAWHQRQRLIVEVQGPLPEPAPTLSRNWWELPPSLSLKSEVVHFLLTANVVDARDPANLRFAPRDRAIAAGAEDSSRHGGRGRRR